MTTVRVELSVAGRSFQLDVVEGDHISRVIASTGDFYEQGLLEDLTRRTRAGDLVVDVGAYIGNHTIFMAGVADLEVIAIEPFPASADLLASNVELNGLSGSVEIVRAAAGSVTGSAAVQVVDEHNLGMVRILPGRGPIDVVSVDEIVAGRRVTALKIDVEGMELDVLDGAISTITESEPVIYVETGDVLAERGVLAWMDDRGYRFTREFNETPTRLFTPADESLANLYPKDLIDFGATQVEALADLIAVVRGLRADHHRFSNEVKEYREQVRRTTSLVSEFYKRVKAGSGELAEVHREMAEIRGILEDWLDARESDRSEE